MLAVIDNYDSFTYNLVQYLGELGADIHVFRNDQVTIDHLATLSPTHLVISPGPGDPNDGGISNAAIQRFSGQLPILGVCLGHQCIGHTFGGTVDLAMQPMHGKTDRIHHDGKEVYAGMSNPFTATRYHSLIILKNTMPPEFAITAWTERDEIMGVRHKSWPLEGVQFHPESFLTEEGSRLLANFLAK